MNIPLKVNGEKFMETNSQVNKENNKFEIIESQIRECFGKVVYSHKTHEKCADILTTLHSRIKLWQIILSAITTTSFLVSIFGGTKVGAIIGSILAAILFALNMYTKDYDLGVIAKKHSDAANELWNIRESYLSLITDIKNRIVLIEQIQLKRDELQNKLFEIYKGSPKTNFKAYNKARKALKLDEELTFSDEEIDNFLPKKLRKNQ